MDISKIKEIGSRVRSGAWVKDIPVLGFEDVALRVRGANNADARRLRDVLVREAAGASNAPLSPDQIDVINDKIIVEAILLDWNLAEDDEPLPFSKEKAAALLADGDIGPLMREAVSWAAATVGSRGLDEIEEAAKN